MSRRGASQRRVVIAGGGPVGLMVAALLAADERTAGTEIRVLDARSLTPWSAGELDLRVYALSRASQRLFEQLGLWEGILGRRAAPYRAMHVWEGSDPTGPASVRFEAADVGEPDLGHIVEDSLLRDRLIEFLQQAPSVTVAHECAIESVAREGRRLVAQTSAGEELRADLLVGADGVDSRVRAQLALRAFRHDYAQEAVVAHVATRTGHRDTAWQRFLPSGPLALLPLSDGRSSVVWSLPSGEARARLQTSAADFSRALEEASCSVLGPLELTSPRASFPLTMLHAVQYCAQSVALAGDAAHSVHPLAGQGMNLGLLDAACLGAVLGDAAERGEYIGDRIVLDRYARRRKAHNLSMQLAFDALDRIFRWPAWLEPVRTLGIMSVDRAAPAKRLLMARAMGLEALESATGGPDAAS